MQQEDRVKHMLKNHLKILPIWTHCEAFQVDLELFHHEVDTYTEGLVRLEDRMALLDSNCRQLEDETQSIKDAQACKHDKNHKSNVTNSQIARKSTCCNRKEVERLEINMDVEQVAEDTEIIPLDEDPVKMKCTNKCLDKRERDNPNIIDEFRDYSDLQVPLQLGWNRKMCIITLKVKKPKYVIVYIAPCGKKLQTLFQIRRHLIQTQSSMDIDYFSFERDIKLHRAIGVFRPIVHFENIAKDSKGNGLENKNISLMNLFSNEVLPPDFEYCNRTFPHPLLAAKNFSFNHEFKSGCDCEDDCYQRSSCPCHQLNEEFFGKTKHNRGTVETRCQYNNKRLPHQVATGIFECNSFCKCSSRCNNRVVQNGIRFRLQVHKTLDKGWGVVTLDDIPKGAFICTYAAELLDDADQFGDSDMYYADLDFISVNEEAKLRRVDSDEGIGRPEDDRISILDKLDSADYTLDARRKGNVGRFFNHSCDPNAFVQNVFVETHDLRFPEVAFFAIRTIKSMQEITWNYNYKLGTIVGRRIDCRCNASNCKGRIL